MCRGQPFCDGPPAGSRQAGVEGSRRKESGIEERETVVIHFWCREKRKQRQTPPKTAAKLPSHCLNKFRLGDQVSEKYVTAVCFPRRCPFDLVIGMYPVLICGHLEYWKWGAITAIGFMAFVSFLGWWYQRRMRLRFTERELPLLSSLTLYFKHILTACV